VFSGQSVGQTKAVRGGVSYDLHARMLFAARFYNPNESSDSKLDFCLTVHHQLGKVIQKNQLDATMIY